MAGEGLRIHRTNAMIPYLRRNVKGIAPVFPVNLASGFPTHIPAIGVTRTWLRRAGGPARHLLVWTGWLARRTRHPIGAPVGPIIRCVRRLRLAGRQGSAGSAIMLDMPVDI